MLTEKININNRLSLLLLLLYAVFSLSETLSSIMLYVAVPGSALLMWIGSKDRTLVRPLRLLLYLFLWIAITSFFAYMPDIATLHLKRIGCVFMLCFAVSQMAKKERMIPWIYLIWCMMYIVCLFYAKGQMDANNFDYTTDRMNDDKVNANQFGYYTFFFTYIVYYYGELKNFKFKKLTRNLFLLTIPLSFYIAIITGSRQILLVQVPLIAFLLYLRYIKGGSNSKRFSFIIAIIIAAIILIPSALNIYSSSNLAVRSDRDVKEDVRAKLIEDGIQTGLEHPITGVGIGCFGYYNYGHSTFAHNTYAELFATTGIVGLTIFAMMLIIFISKQWKRYRQTRDTQYLMFCFIGCMYALDNNFYVFHTDPWLTSFFIMLSTHAEVYHNKQISSNL